VSVFIIHFLKEEDGMRNVVLKVCTAFFLSVCTAFGWTSGALTVTVTNSPMDINVAAGGTTLADITGLTFGTSAITAISSVATTTDSLVLALSGNISVTIKTVQGGIYFYSTNPASIASVSLTLKDQNEHFYGITEHNIATSPDLRGKTVPCKIFTNVQSDEDAEAYSSFYFTSLGYAGFFNSFAYGSYSFGVSGKTTILHNTSNINWYLLYGPTLSKIQQSYYKIIGAPKKVPMWACGPLVWHDNFTGSAMMLAYADSFATDSIPLFHNVAG
jgi:alpha-glucosidase (family GH31 glycosyl hydrolase)